LNASALLRHAWMDLLSAAGFLAVFVFRERFAPETLSALLLWPVLFESMLVLALGVASMFNGIASTWVRNLSFALIVVAFLGLAWLGGRGSGLPYLGLAALWLLGARLTPPPGLPWFGSEHRHWIFNGGMTSYIVAWVPALFAFLMLTAAIDGDCHVDTAGDRVCKSPAWIFAAVWVPYFIAEALVRAYGIAAWRAKRGLGAER
jgi:hypothetical protein